MGCSTETGETLDLEYGNIGVSGIGTLGSRIVNTSSSGIATVQLTFTPSANIGIQAQVYMTALKTEDDSKTNWEFNNASVVSDYSEYEGTERDIKKAFDMQHETTPIFNRSFSGDDSDIVEFGDLDKLLLTAMIKTISTAEIQALIQETENYIDANFNNKKSNIQISGLSVFINDFVNIIVQSSITSILLSIILILFITGLFFRSIKWGLLSIVPLASAIILNFGLMGIFGVDLNHMTALLSAVIIGVGVDFSIHYISDYRRNLINKIDTEKINLQTSQDVGYPVLLDVVSNMGFIALLFSILIPLNHMGGLMVFAMISTSFGTLTVLASLIQILKIKKV